MMASIVFNVNYDGIMQMARRWTKRKSSVHEPDLTYDTKDVLDLRLKSDGVSCIESTDGGTWWVDDEGIRYWMNHIELMNFLQQGNMKDGVAYGKWGFRKNGANQTLVYKEAL